MNDETIDELERARGRMRAYAAARDPTVAKGLAIILKFRPRFRLRGLRDRRLFVVCRPPPSVSAAALP